MSYCYLRIVLTGTTSWRVSNEAHFNWCQEEICLHGQILSYGPGWFAPNVISPWLNKPAYVHLGTEEDEIGLIRTYTGLFGDLKDSFAPSEILKKYCGFFHYAPSSSENAAESPAHVYLFLSSERFATLLMLSLDTYRRNHEIHLQLTLEGKAVDSLMPISLGDTNFGVSLADADIDAVLTLLLKEYQFVSAGSAQPGSEGPRH